MSITLPIEPLLDPIVTTLSQHPILLLEAPPGAGKSTRVPLALLKAEWLHGQTILMLEPRRLAARGVASYMAAMLGEAVGQQVGYRVRFESKVSANTRIEVITEGILTRRLQRDPELNGVGMVIFDEFHERSIHSDLALALCHDSQQGLRPELRLLIMSATLEGDRLERLLQAPRMVSSGHQHPVTISYRPTKGDAAISLQMAAAIHAALEAHHGDILAFLPGEREILHTIALLQHDLAPEAVDLLPLYGALSMEAQRQALTPAGNGRRKVVLATDIAETSLTIEGIRIVIDSGLQRRPRFSPRTGMTALETARISQASATQRSGRAGRLAPGYAIRLWSEHEQRGLIPFQPPEIMEADLIPLALELAHWGVVDASTLTWVDPPAPAALSQARQMLRQLDALDDQLRITPMGLQLSNLPLHPRLAYMLVRAQQLGVPALGCDLAALISEPDLMVSVGSQNGCDLTIRLELLQRIRVQGWQSARSYGADPQRCRRVDRAARQWLRLLGATMGAPGQESQLAGVLLAFAYPDRIAQQRTSGSDRYLLANGRGARLAPRCATRPPLMVALQLDDQGAEGRIHLAIPLTQEALARHLNDHIHWHEVIEWESRQRCVVTRSEQSLGALVLEQRPLQRIDAERYQTALIQGIAESTLTLLPWTPHSRQLQARIISLHHWFTDEGWPHLTDDYLLGDLQQWLSPYLGSIRTINQLQQLDLYTILLQQLDWEQQQQLERLAPPYITVPSGSRKQLLYSTEAAPPILKVKLQELFGLDDGPRIAHGRVAVMLHLLSPAQRPIQVTQDLRGFWAHTYAEVRRELRGRYPKHPWPEEPHSTPPTARVTSRSR